MSFRSIGGVAVPLALAFLGACAESTVPAEPVYHPTLVAISPAEFLSAPGEPAGPIPCVDAEGAMRSYVATVFNVEYLPDGSPVTADDVATGDAVAGPTPGVSCEADANPGTDPRATVGFALPSTAPTDCHAPVAISRLGEFHRYRAEIDGYDREGLVPLAPGLRLMVDPNTGERVAPTWRFSCGDDCPESVDIAVTRTLGDCKRLPSETDDNGGPPSGPANVVIAADALTGATCGSESGEIERLEVQYTQASGQSATASGACGTEIELDDVLVRGTLNVSVLAYEAGTPEARWGTTCAATPVAGLTVPVTCAPLHDEGPLDVDPATALAALGYDCAALGDLPGELELTLVDDAGMGCMSSACAPRYVDPSNCNQLVRFSGLQTGLAHVTATLLQGASSLGMALCSGTVIPASAPSAASATCSMEP
jgi:hypothetical protein